MICGKRNACTPALSQPPLNNPICNQINKLHVLKNVNSCVSVVAMDNIAHCLTYLLTNLVSNGSSMSALSKATVTNDQVFAKLFAVR